MQKEINGEKKVDKVSTKATTRGLTTAIRPRVSVTSRETPRRDAGDVWILNDCTRINDAVGGNFARNLRPYRATRS